MPASRSAPLKTAVNVGNVGIFNGKTRCRRTQLAIGTSVGIISRESVGTLARRGVNIWIVGSIASHNRQVVSLLRRNNV